MEVCQRSELPHIATHAHRACVERLLTCVWPAQLREGLHGRVGHTSPRLRPGDRGEGTWGTVCTLRPTARRPPDSEQLESSALAMPALPSKRTGTSALGDRWTRRGLGWTECAAEAVRRQARPEHIGGSMPDLFEVPTPSDTDAFRRDAASDGFGEGAVGVCCKMPLQLVLAVRETAAGP